jgi:PAS domain S-box-containing protein
MPDPEHISGEDALHLVKLTEKAVNSKDLAELASNVLPILVRAMGVPGAFFYFAEPRPSTHAFFPRQAQDLTVPAIEKICLAQFHRIPLRADFQPVRLSLVPPETAQVALFLLHDKGKRLGLLGLLLPENRKLPKLKLIEKVVFLLNQFITQLVQRLECEKRIANFKAYFTVSSKIAKAMNLRDVLEAVLYSSMEAVSGEAASVMLLDEEKKNFQFFGMVPPQPAITDAIFPADLGLAGHILQSQRSEIINDVQHDPRFYKRFDLETGFQTKTMVAVPLVAGIEKIGVLEVLNKSGGQLFQEEDRLLLQSIAEEIAFAIHDAKLSDAKQALTAEIEKMHQFQTKLIQTSNDGIIAHDPHGNIIIFNEGAERILGYRQKEAIGRINVARLYPPGIAQEVRAKITGPEYGGAGRLIHYEIEALSKTGEQIPVELSAILIYENDRELATVGFFRDLRERQQLQEKLLQAERLAALGHMAAHISHEVKNPLMIIGGLARRVLKESAADPQLNLNRLKIIVEEIKRLEDFLLEVGSFARLSGAKKTSVNLNALIQEMALQLEASLNEKNIELSLNLDPQLPEVKFDPLHFRQVLLNIAKNSIEAMPSGGHLTFASGCHHENVYVKVSDTGEGIPPDILEKIFNPFYSTKPKGSGLGLAISKTIIEAHQGQINVESLPGQGTRVTILLKATS